MKVTERGSGRRTFEETTEGLDREQRTRLIAAALAVLANATHPKRVQDARMVLWVLHTGAHPEVMAHPKTSFLRVEGAYAHWERAKTRAPVKVALDPVVRPWAADFVAGLQEPVTHTFTPQRYTVTKEVMKPDPARPGVLVRVKEEEVRQRQQDVCSLSISKRIQRTCTRLGFPRLSARGLRHSFGILTAERSNNNIDVICRALSCTVDVARVYIQRDKDAAKAYEKAMLAGGAPAG